MTLGEVIEHFWPLRPLHLVLGGDFIGLAAWVLLVATWLWRLPIGTTMN